MNLAREFAVAAALFAVNIPGWTATITVDTVDPNPMPDGWCSLIEAIENANADGAVHTDCPAGAGSDFIELGAGLTYTLDTVHNETYGPNGLPVITSEMTINGHHSTVEREDLAPDFRILCVEASGDVALNDLTVRNGVVTFPDGGGAILNLGTLVLVGSGVRDSNAFQCGGLLNQGGMQKSSTQRSAQTTRAMTAEGYATGRKTVRRV